MLLSSGMTLDRGVVHQSVISRLQSLPSGQTSDASYSTDEVSRNQRRGPFSDTITLGGVTLKGSYFANPQQLSGMGGVNMMSVDCHLPSFTLLLPGQTSVLKPSIQSSRGKLLTLEEAVDKSGFAQMLFFINDTDPEAAWGSLNEKERADRPDSEVIFKPLENLRMINAPNRQRQNPFYAGAEGEANFNPLPLEDESNPFEASGAPMEAPAPSQPLAMGAIGDAYNIPQRRDEIVTAAYKTNLIGLIQRGAIPVVFAFCNWGCTYTAQPACLSSGKSCYDLHSSGDAMLERRASNQVLCVETPNCVH